MLSVWQGSRPPQHRCRYQRAAYMLISGAATPVERRKPIRPLCWYHNGRFTLRANHPARQRGAAVHIPPGVATGPGAQVSAWVLLPVRCGRAPAENRPGRVPSIQGGRVRQPLKLTRYRNDVGGLRPRVGRLLQRARLPWAQKATVPDPLTVRWSRLRAAKRERPRKRALPCLKNPHQAARKYRSHPRKHPRLLKKNSVLFEKRSGKGEGNQSGGGGLVDLHKGGGKPGASRVSPPPRTHPRPGD